MILATLPAIGAGVLALALGAVVGGRGRHRLPAMSFAAGMAGLAAAQVGSVIVLGSGSPAGVAVAMVAQLAMLPPWMLFAVGFAANDARRQVAHWWWPIGLATAIAAGFIGAAALHPFAVEITTAQGPVLALTRLGKATLILSLLGAVFVMFQLETTLRNSSGVSRWNVKYFVLSLFGVFGGQVFMLSQELLFGRVLADRWPLHSTILVLSLGLMAFAVLRHRLLQVDVFVSRHAVYSSAVVAAVAAYLLALGVAGEALSWLGIQPDFFVVALAIFVSAMLLLSALLSERVRGRTKHLISKHFYRHKYDYRQEWARFTADVSRIERPEAISGRILAQVTETLAIPAGALWLHGEREGWKLAATLGLWPEPLDLAPPPGPSTDETLFPVSMPGLPLTRAVRLESRGEVVGLLALGEPRHGRVTLEDEELVATLATQAAVVIINARLSEELARSREMEAFHRLSTFVLHDLKNCVAMLSLVSQNAERHGGDPTFQREAFHTVGESVRQMQELIGKLARVPAALEDAAPSRINKLVEDEVARVRAAAAGRVEIRTELDSGADTVRVSEETVRAITANLLVNAVEAIEASGRIEVHTTRHGGWVTLKVADTGCGMSEDFVRNGLFVPLRTTKPTGLGIGLYHVKSAVEGLGGQIRVETQRGQGTTFWIDFPCRESKG
jgi:signal transduction histidine kinase